MQCNANQLFSARNFMFGLVVWLGACNELGGINVPILDEMLGIGGGGRGGDGGINMTGGGAGEGGSAGAGGGEPAVCMSGTSVPCYSGAPGTENVGNCKGGMKTCLQDGSAYGPCMDEVVPAMSEDCGATGDEDCNGFANDVAVCPCMPMMLVECHTNMPGICARGSGTCAADGMSVEMCGPIESPRFDWCTTPEDDDCDGTAVTECQGTVEVNSFGMTNPNTGNDDRILGVATTLDGGYVVAGYVNGTEASGGAITAGSAYVARINPDGKTTLWEKTFTSTAYASARGVAVDPMTGDVVIVGFYNGTLEFGTQSTMSSTGADIFIVKLKGDTGDYIWHRAYGAPSTQWPWAVDVDAAGNIFTTGTIDTNPVTFGTETFSPLNDDIFVLSLDPVGTIRWVKHFRSNNVQQGKALLVLPGGDIVIGCDTNWGIDFGGGTRSSKGAYDIALARLRGIDGSHQWSKIVGNSNSAQNIRDLAFTRHKDASGNYTDYIVATGGYGNSLDIGGGPHPTTMSGGAYVAEFNANSGAFRRDLVAGTAGGTASSALAVDGAGDVVLAAWFNSTMDWGSTDPVMATNLDDAYVVKLDGETWAPRWTKLLTGTNVQRGIEIDVDSKGRIIVGGWFTEELILGDLLPNVMGKGGDDAFVVRLTP